MPCAKTLGIAGDLGGVDLIRVQRIVVARCAGILDDLGARQVLDHALAVGVADLQGGCLQCHCCFSPQPWSTGRSVVTPTPRAVITSSPFWSRYSVTRSRNVSLPARLLSFSQVLPGLVSTRQHVAGADVAVVFVMLFGVQAAGGGRLALDPAGAFGGAEPFLAGLRAQVIVGVELRDRLGEAGRGDDAAGFGVFRRRGVVIHRVGVADRAGEHHDVARFHGKCDFGQGFPPFARARTG